METMHPKKARGLILKILYDHYQRDPMEMVLPEHVLEGGAVTREDLVANMHYLQDRGLVELIMGYSSAVFAGARITADGIDLVEDSYRFALLFPPESDSPEAGPAQLPLLIERLASEADFSPLDGEERMALMRDVMFLRDEAARPAHRWRTKVILAILDWMGDHFKGYEASAESCLPSRDAVREIVGRIQD